MPLNLTDEVRYRILRSIEEDPTISQRDLAAKLGVSLGKANFCLRALIDKGVIKARRFCNTRNKSAYLYVLTPAGVRHRTQITVRFLKKKMAEYDALQQEIVELRQWVQEQHADRPAKEPQATTFPGPGADSGAVDTLLSAAEKKTS